MHGMSRKRLANLKKHGLDFHDAAPVFAGVTYTYEDVAWRTVNSDSSCWASP
jgi:uncharacterized DUF497 family protein